MLGPRHRRIGGPSRRDFFALLALHAIRESQAPSIGCLLAVVENDVDHGKQLRETSPNTRNKAATLCRFSAEIRKRSEQMIEELEARLPQNHDMENQQVT